jgi:hypothetical protein
MKILKSLETSAYSENSEAHFKFSKKDQKDQKDTFLIILRSDDSNGLETGQGILKT